MTGYLGNIWRLRFFWLALVGNDLRNRYRRSIIGIGWSLLHPIMMTIVLCVVFAGLFKSEVRVFCPYLITGLVTWNFFSAAINEGAQSFFKGESYIRQMPAPLAIYPLRTVLGAGFHFLFGLLVALLLTVFFQGSPNFVALLSLVPSAVVLLLAAWALAVFFGLMNVLFHDTQHLAEVLLQVLFYCTPILYRPEVLRERGMGWLVNGNPFTWLIELVRQPILERQMPPLEVWGAASLSCLFFVGLAVILLVRLERRVIFYL